MSESVGLFRSREQFNLGNQLHSVDYKTHVLNFQALKLFLLALLDGFRADVASRASVITFCSQHCVITPRLAAEAFRLFFQFAGSNFLEQTAISAEEHFRGALTNKCTWFGTLATAASAGVTSTAKISRPYSVVISANGSFNLASIYPIKTFSDSAVSKPDGS